MTTTDRAALDAIAHILSDPDEWDGAADFLDTIADVIGRTGRPHPGRETAADELAAWEAANPAPVNA